MLYIHTSNQLENLKNQYASMVKTPLKDVFKAETVVVQNAGMARWLSMEMSQISGISANTEFLFPAEFMWNLLRLVSPDIPEHSQCAPDTLRFHIFEELCNHFDDYPELHHYIFTANASNIDASNQINLLSIWELSCQSARILDQYLFYRSEWINTWESGSSSENANSNKKNEHHADHWQARLWNRCVKAKGLLHWLALQEQFSKNIETIDSSLLEERISFFSMSALSPGYVELLGGIAQKTDIHIFIINPCEDVYWGDIKSPKSHAKLDSDEQEYMEVGNPLLASLGKQGQDFIDKLLEIPHQTRPYIATDTAYDDESSNSLLALIQQDIYNLEQPALRAFNEEFDDSIQFNACHTAMREVEVLHDKLLAELDADSNLAPSDIVVMMPDIEKYAPYIESVFGHSLETNSSNNKKQKLPFSIADRDPEHVFKIIQALNKIFVLPDSHFDVESVFELLEYDEIATHFDLDKDQLNYCRELALETNIRWGISSQTRQRSNLPNTEEHTWKYALDRMLLGYTLTQTGNSEELFASNRPLNILAYKHIEGNNALVLSHFKHFTDTIFAIHDWQKDSLTLEDWLIKTNTLITQISPESTDQQRLFKSLADLQLKANLADFNQVLSFPVFQKILQQCLSDISANEKYLGYGITFCALVPMRSVPFKIVALMGMNDGEFPRQESRPSFDLSAAKKIPGDRSRRDEDRYLFLESLLAARNKLIISYIGQSIKDNTSLPPSILVSELLDSLFVYQGTETKDWIVKHPLHAFSPRYFLGKQEDKQQLFSYASQYLKINNINKHEEDINSDFIAKPLENLDDKFKQLTLNDLINFYINPTRTFLQQRFNIETYENNLKLNTREPFEIESFKENEIRNLIYSNQNNDEKNNDATDKKLMARAKGLLPYGQIGDEIYAREKHIVETFQQALPIHEYQTDQHISLTIGEFQLNARIDQLTDIGRYIKQVGKPFASDYIRLWLTHLCMNTAPFDSTQVNTQTQFYSPKTRFQLNRVEDPQQQLHQLLNTYWRGLHYPLTFFPKSGFSLFSKTGQENKFDMSNRWNGTQQFSGEKDSFEYWLLHRNITINRHNQPEEFMEISHQLFGKLHSSLSKIG